MTRSLLDDAFAHHVWATLEVIDACAALTDDQLETTVPGTYGSIRETLRHLVDSDSWYLFRLSGERHPHVEADGMSLAELRATMERHGRAWREVLAEEPDPDEIVVARQDDGAEYHAPKGVRLAQVLHHGTEHRSQVRTALTSLGIETPEFGAWEYGDQAGRTKDVPAPG